MACSRGVLRITKTCFVLGIGLLLTINGIRCRPGTNYGDAKVPDNEPSKDGTVVKIGGLNAYVSGPSKAKSAVLIASDVFGYGVVNLRKIADKVGVAGYYAVVPDFFHGNPYNGVNFTKWKARHPPAKALNETKPLIKALRDKGVSAIAGAGFCYGAHVVMGLAKSRDLKAAVFLHPTDIIADDFKEIEIPTAILGGEYDSLVPPTVIKHYGKILSSKYEIPSYVKIFPGVEHGWTTRYNSTNQKAAEEAQQDMLNWIIKFDK